MEIDVLSYGFRVLAKWLKNKICARREEEKGWEIKFTWVGILIHFEQKLRMFFFSLHFLLVLVQLVPALTLCLVRFRSLKEVGKKNPLRTSYGPVQRNTIKI